MPKKLQMIDKTPTIVQERLSIWGRCIYSQRITQRIPTENLCNRLGISRTTLRRIEQGDATVGISYYMAALYMVGVLDMLVPIPDKGLWNVQPGSRIRQKKAEQSDDYF